MIRHILSEGRRVFYTDEGKGDVLVLLHGFTESMRIWDRFRKKLSKDLRVITMDLPGHGMTENFGQVHSMEKMADLVMTLLKARKVRRCTMIGHSMGGYVTLAFAARYPAMLVKMGLFHSHPFPDTEEQRSYRDRASRIAEENKSGYIMNFIPELFAEQNREMFREEILELLQKANQMTKEGVIASLQGMKLREDQTLVLKQLDIPVMLIIGQKDSKFPQERLQEMITLPKQAHCLILRESGHMGYIEEEKITLEFVKKFVK